MQPPIPCLESRRRACGAAHSPVQSSPNPLALRTEKAKSREGKDPALYPLQAPSSAQSASPGLRVPQT